MKQLTKTRDVLDLLSKREDTEHAQALIRLIIASAGLLYVSWTNGFTMQALELGALTLQMVALASTALSLAFLYHIINHPEVNVVRRFVGIAHDITAVTIFFHYRPELASLLLFVYPFSAIGNGFRYGEKWLLISALMGSAGLAFLLSSSDYWSSISLISTGLAVNFLTVVTYTGLLLRKLRSTTAKLEELATHDALTGLPNRRLMMNLLRDSLVTNARARRTMACIYFDLDGFKLVNDTLGHGAGDILLQEVGRRARLALRQSDLIARLGGDEFSIIVESVKSRDDAEMVCRRIVKAVEDITLVNGQPVNISVSVGCVIVTPHRQGRVSSTAEDTVMRHADECMYESKKSGRGRYTIAEHAPKTSTPPADAPPTAVA